MKEANANFKNSGNDEDNLIEFFSGNNNCLSEPSHGIGDYSIYSEEFHEKDIPVKISERTRLMLTHPNHMITNFNKSFIEMTVEFEVGLEKCFANEALKVDDANINYVFVGFKDAVEIISELKFYCKGELIGSYNQNEMIRESFAYNSIRPKDVKNGTSHSHSLWENVINMSPNVAGCYISLKDLYWTAVEDQKWVKIKMDLIIPFTDTLALQYWRLYPNYLLGDIIAEIRTSLDGLVWCQIPPENVAKIKQLQSYYNQCPYIHSGVNLSITRHFTQIDQVARIVSKIESKNSMITSTNNAQFSFYSDYVHWLYTVDINRLILKPNSAIIKIGRTNCIGFNIKDEVSNSITNILNSGKEIRIPALELKRIILEQTANINGLKISKVLPVHNTTNIKIMFPRNINDITVYRNVMYENCQLIIDKVAYPYHAYKNTFDARFITHQLQSYELDNTRATRELVESLSQPLNDVSVEKPEKDYGRYLNSLWDDTNFGINFQLERGNAGFNFEGADTKGVQVLLEFKGQPVAKTKIQANGTIIPYDTYLFPITDAEGEVILDIYDPLPPPELWIFEYKYWSWTIDGVDYKTDFPDWMTDSVQTSSAPTESSFQLPSLI